VSPFNRLFFEPPQLSDFNLAIGTICYLDDILKDGACIDAYGVTGTPYPSATSNTYTPVETPVSNTAGGVIFSPADAWTEITTNESCSKSGTLHTTSTLNATISFNYTGKLPAITHLVLHAN
jgi:hypothetical protein